MVCSSSSVWSCILVAGAVAVAGAGDDSDFDIDAAQLIFSILALPGY